ncbi:MAG: hypothetical protein COV67_13600 [Nitrospinae bacterium CG11_big_fil_rev_8_21_14_0_20_56_8]|nr:MAG: hypothetical protein COV67_13600 [Nitrospinae bacterium CG11_big_fil_rev_8_21_14_0_20_56_8]
MVIPDILTHLVELAANVAEAFTVALYSTDHASKNLVLKRHMTLSSHFDEEAVIPFGLGHIGKVATTRKPYLQEYFEDNSTHLKIYKKDEDLKSFLAIPVIFKDLEGVLVIDSKERYGFTPKIQKILTGFAEQAAWHLHRERIDNSGDENIWPFFREMNSYGRFLIESPDREALSQRLIQIPPEILEVDAIAVVWFDEECLRGRIEAHRGFTQGMINLRVVPGKGVAGSCAKNRAAILFGSTGKRPLTLFDENEKPESLETVAAVPILLNERLYGVLVCGSLEPDAVTRADIDRLTLISTSAAAALLCEETRRRWHYDKNMDQVTGTPNHRFLMEHNRAVAEELFRNGEPVFFLTVFMANLQSLYEIHGFEKGDKLLRQIVSMFSKVTPSPKYVFKYSDNAFLIVLMKRDRQEVLSLESRLKHVFDQTPFYVDGKPMALKVEAGTSAYPEDSKDLVELIGLSWGKAARQIETVS